jgi:hypothetical protein
MMRASTPARVVRVLRSGSSKIARDLVGATGARRVIGLLLILDLARRRWRGFGGPVGFGGGVGFGDRGRAGLGDRDRVEFGTVTQTLHPRWPFRSSP